MAISINNEVLFANAVGYADVVQKIPATINTQYSVGSIAKPMTAIALAKLIDDGTVSLSDSIYQYLPSYTRHDEDITIKQLASHTAGIDHMSSKRKLLEFVHVQDHASPIEVINILNEQQLLFKPGSDFRYSSNGYILLSALIESASKRNYVDYMKNEVWLPLDMENTELDTSFAGGANEATYYKERSKSGSFVPATLKRDRSFLFGGGGFISTPSDLVKLSGALFNDNYLSQESRKALTTAVKLDDGTMNSQFYGLGWRMGEMNEISISNKNFFIVHHGGVMGDAATSFLLLIPEFKAAIAFATNIEPEKYWEMRPKAGKALLEFITSTGRL